MRLPPFSGEAILIEIRASLGGHLAAASIPGRRILIDAAVFDRPGDFERILVHELFHFVWVRAGNPSTRAWEEILTRELRRGARGELGWSSEWRKRKLSIADARHRTPRWRRYACESFCDTAAWLFAQLRSHDEFTLPVRFRSERRAWMKTNFCNRRVPI